ncbi:MAG TPA: hypothetical protein VFU49_21825 [Ktedonobacteraceae bacterium]|nr:hypothetical protein [Ktedonobacteraceae bacterium]
MRRNHRHPAVRGLGKSLLATVIALCLLSLASMGVLADAVNISDQAGVLNASQVRSAGSSLGYPVDIYTTNNFVGSNQSFNQRTTGHIDNARKIVMAIDTSNRYVAIAGGRSVPLTNSQYNDAVSAFRSSFANSGYTGATVATLRSLQNSLAASGRNNGGAPVPSGGGIFGNFLTSTLCCIGLIVLALIAVFAFVRRRATRGFFNRGNAYNQPYNQPYNQGGYPPNYYGPGQGQGGMNPWAAGGLGAAAGGLIGYELGKNQGERGEGGDQGGFGGGAGGGFGGDQGDFGGGAGGGFGGDQGGGFGGGDFGGGGGGDFGGGGGSGSGGNF